MTKTLQQITDAWGGWMNKKYSGGGIKFTESTNYGKHSELDQYHQYETSATYSNLTYDPNAPSPVPGTVDSVTTSYNNGSSVQQSYTYQQSTTTQQSFTWSITESLSIGVEVSATVGVPSVAQVGTKVTTSLSLSSTQGATSTSTQNWSVSQPIIAPPMTHIDATMVVSTQEYDIKWTAQVVLDGYVAIWFNNKVTLSDSKHWLYFIPIQYVFSDCQKHDIIDTSGYQISGGTVIASSSGKFKGGQGVAVSINVKESALQAQKGLAASAAATRDYTIPIDENGGRALVGAPDEAGE